MFDDEKIKLIRAMPEGDKIILIWVQLLILAAKVNQSGFLILNENLPYTQEMLAVVLNEKPATVELAIATLLKLQMIIIQNETLIIKNFEKHQNVEGLERIKEQNRRRISNFRTKTKEINSLVNDSNVTVTQSNVTSNVTNNVTDNVTVTQSNATDIDKDIEKEIEKEIDSGERDLVQEIFVRSYYRNPLPHERDIIQIVLKRFGFEKTLKIFKDARYANFRNFKKLLDRLDEEGNIISDTNRNMNKKNQEIEVSCATSDD